MIRARIVGALRKRDALSDALNFGSCRLNLIELLSQFERERERAGERQNLKLPVVHLCEVRTAHPLSRRCPFSRSEQVAFNCSAITLSSRANGR